MMSIKEWLTGMLDPIYAVFGKSVPVLLVILAFALMLYLLSKLRSWIRSKSAKKYKVGTTNKWFSWEDYDEYISNMQKERMEKKKSKQ